MRRGEQDRAVGRWCSRYGFYELIFRCDLEQIVWKEEGGVDDMYQSLCKTVDGIARRRIGILRLKSRGKKCNRWWNGEIKRARKERKELNREQKRLHKVANGDVGRKREYEETWDKYKKKQREVKNLIRKARANVEREIVEELREKGEEGGRDWYAFLREEEDRVQPCVDEILVGEEILKGAEDIKREIKKFWEEVGGMTEQVELGEVNIESEKKIDEEMDEHLSKEEIRRYLKKLKNRKAAGRDGIPNEFYKEGGEGIVEELYKLFRQIWQEKRVPRKWNEGRVMLLHKGGHKSRKLLKNYRPIAVMNTVGKIFSGLVNDRISECCERNRVMGEEQNGFRKDRRGEDNMFVVSSVLEKGNKMGGKTYLAFLDIEKAYDRVNRSLLCRLLSKIGLSDRIVSIIRSMYDDTRAVYRLGDIETDWVGSRRGVRQGCVLSPLLFGLYTEELAVRLRKSGYEIRIGEDKLSSLLYADDIVIMSEDSGELQEMLNIVAQYGREFGMKYNNEKSQVLVLNGEAADVGRTWDIGDLRIGRTESYKYLGITVDEKGVDRTKQDKIGKANQRLGRLGSVARCRANKYEVVRGLWKGMAVPSLMYEMDGGRARQVRGSTEQGGQTCTGGEQICSCGANQGRGRVEYL